MNTIKKTIMDAVVWSAKASSLVLLITAGAILGVWITINALTLII